MQTEVLKSLAANSPYREPQGAEENVNEMTEAATAAPIRLMKMVTAFGQGGTEGQVNSLLRGMDRSRYDVSFGCFKRWGRHLDEIESWNLKVSEFRLSSLYSPQTLLRQMELARILKARKIQILHSYNFYSNVFAIPAARMAGVPVIVASIRDQGVYQNKRQLAVHKWIAAMADQVLVNADSIRNWLLDGGFPAEKLLTIRNGIDVNAFQRPAKAPALRHALGFEPEDQLVVMLSRLNPQKGVDNFLEAASIVAKNHPRAKFLVVGEKSDKKKGVISVDSAYHDRLQRLAQRLGLSGKVVFTGRRSDVPDLLSEASVSVLPSLSEGLPNSLMESMAAGVPVVASRVGGIPELVREGETGYLVNPDSVPELANAIGRILANKELADRFSVAARARVEKHFSLDRMVRETEAVYHRLLEEKGVDLSAADKAGGSRTARGTGAARF